MTRDGPWMSSVVARALRQDRRVELALDDREIHLEIDGDRLTEDAALPLESFEYPLKDRRGPNVSEDALTLADDIMFSGPNPRCPRCYGRRTRYTVTTDGRTTTVTYCYGCKRAVPSGGSGD